MSTSALTGDDPPAQTAPEPEIRPIESRSDLLACVELQRETWGQGFSDVIPASMLQITAKMGGVVSGAFAEDGTLVGFVYGITGPKGGALAHWSHMLAVRADVRDLGIGRRLKLHQKELLLASGVETMYWTYDPLVARNAHLNLNRLGARVVEYVADMYGASDSELHQLGTDRFVVRWDLDADTYAPRSPPPEPDNSGHPSLRNAEDVDAAIQADPARVDVLIPSDIEALETRAYDDALGWRKMTRRGFGHFLSHGYEVTGFVPGPEHSRYIVSRPDRAR